MNKEEINEIQGKLEHKFSNGKVRYIGCERFTVKIKNQYLLFDNNFKEILSAREYDSIYLCTNGLIVVSKNSLESFSDDNTFNSSKKFGLIDKDGKEVLPCEYEIASPKPGGVVELRREGIDFYAPIKEIIEGKYNWEVYNDYYKNRKK